MTFLMLLVQGKKQEQKCNFFMRPFEEKESYF